jgi:hypothetical protein
MAEGALLEERWLRQELEPEAYDNYRRRVPMLLPFGPTETWFLGRQCRLWTAAKCADSECKHPRRIPHGLLAILALFASNPGRDTKQISLSLSQLNGA